jgi:predicted exporter
VAVCRGEEQAARCVPLQSTTTPEAMALPAAQAVPSASVAVQKACSLPPKLVQPLPVVLQQLTPSLVRTRCRRPLLVPT